MSCTHHSAVRTLPLCRDVALPHLIAALPPEQLVAVLDEANIPEERVQRLDLHATLLVLIAMHLLERMRLGHVLEHVSHAVRLARPTHEAVAGDSAISHRRKQLGVRPLVSLFRQLPPLATRQTPGAFLGPLRLMAIDGTTLTLADTPANRQAFGAAKNQHGDAVFPQLKAVILVECGTHAVVDAGCWPMHTSEQVGLHRMLRSVTPDMLLLLDRGLHQADVLRQCRERGAHVLGRLPSAVRVTKLAPLADGSWLAELPPQDRGGQRHRPPVRVRLIEYTLDDPATEGTVYRLVTTLLDPVAYPAHTLAVLYHERWEAETTIDELKTHLDLADHPLRSRTPLGVVQEFYGLLIAHYAVRAVMHASAVEAHLDPDRLSFVRAVRILRRYLPDCQRARGEELARLTGLMRAEMRERLLSVRRDRVNPRAVKRRASPYPTKKWVKETPRLRRPVAELIRLN